MDRERHRLVRTVDRARRRVCKMVHARMPAGFENVYECYKVRIDIGLRILERVTNAGLGCKVNHARRRTIRKERLNRGPIRQIKAAKSKVRISLEEPNPSLF